MKNREFVRKVFRQIKDTDIEDLKKGLVSVLIVHDIDFSQKNIFKELNRIGRIQKQDSIGDFILNFTISKKNKAVSWHINHPYHAQLKTKTKNKTAYRLPWHTDRSYHPEPPRFVALYAHSIPKQNRGGDTLFCDLQKAYEDLPEKTIKEIKNLQLLHFNRYMLNPEIKKKKLKYFRILSAVHPLVQSDPLGKYLFFNWDYTADFPLKKDLCHHIYQAKYIYKHHWSSFDMVISNNLKTNHKRNKYNPCSTPRTMSRVHIR